MTDTQTPEYYQWVKAMVDGKLNIPNEIVNHHWRNDINNAPLSAEKVNRAIRKNYHSELQNISWLAQASIPSEGEAVEFLEYCKESRDEFCLVVKSTERSNVLMTAIDSLLICFDQMKERLSSSASPTKAGEQYNRQIVLSNRYDTDVTAPNKEQFLTSIKKK